MDQDIAAETGFREYSSGHVTCRNDSVQMILEKTTLRLQKKSKINSLHCKWHMIYYLRLENQPMFGNRITPTIA